MRTEVAKQINEYVVGYAERNNITVSEALEQNIVKNVIALIKERERVAGKGSN